MRRAAVLLLTVAVIAACGSGAPTAPATSGSSTSSPQNPQTLGYPRGFGLSPRGFPQDYSALASFFSEVSSLGHGAVMWNGAWRDDAVGGANAGTIPAAASAVAQAAAGGAFTPVAVFGWRSGATLLVKVPDNPTNDWTNSRARALYAQTVSAYAGTYRPAMLFLGNENDLYYEQDPVGYAAWIAAYDQAYLAVKAASPATLVGPVFNFEHLSGTGVLNGWTTPNWGALTAHSLSRVDIVGVTTYPFFQYAQPSQLQSGYLQPLFSQIGARPIAVTETGWPAERLGGLNPLWSGSPQAQVDFIPALVATLQGHDVRLLNWLHLYMAGNDGSLGWKIFGSVSLRDAAGAERPAYSVFAAK